MSVFIYILCIICVVQALYIRHVNRQLSEWFVYLKEIRNAPGQKSFAKGNGLIAKINYEINDILDESRNQFVKLARAEEANRKILTNLSHDVRTPLASLIGYLEALWQEKVNVGEQREYIGTAYRKALDLKELVDILFEWFKINSGEWKYQKKEYEVNELTRQSIIGYLPMADKNRIHIEAHIPEQEWFLEIDKIAYERIINNLFDNAVKHGKCSKLVVRTERVDKLVMIEIANDGIMIPKEEMPFLFDRLYKGDPARAKNGSGLGLSIVKELVTAMQGTITAKSAQGETSFCLSFHLM